MILWLGTHKCADAFLFCCKYGFLASLLTKERRQLHMYIQLTIRIQCKFTRHRRGLIMINESLCHFDHCSHTPWICCRKLCSRKCYTRSHIFSWAEDFPTHILIPLTDCWTHQKLSWNLITPLTSTFQPQFFFRRTILAPEAAWQEKMEQCKCSR